MSNLIATCYATLDGYSWEVSSFYFKGKGGRVDLAERRGTGRGWEEWREGKLLLGCNVQEKNKKEKKYKKNNK